MGRVYENALRLSGEQEMKQILIRHTDEISETDALKYAYCAWKDNPYRTGIVAFRDDVVVFFSDRSKYPSMTVCKDKQDNGAKLVTAIMEERK